MPHSISENIPQFIRTVPMAEFDDGAFKALALPLFQYQFARNAIFRGICERQGVVPDRVRDWREIPAVTTSAFKAVPLTCFPLHEAVAAFHTSGTTQKRPGKHYFRTMEFYRTAMLRSFAAYCLADRISDYGFRITDYATRVTNDALRTENHLVSKDAMRMLFLGPTLEHFPNSSLGYMFSGIRDEFGDEGGRVFFSPQGVEVDDFRAALEKASQENVAVFILGTALALLECMEAFQQQNQKFRLPAGSRILDTGGYKGRRVEVTREVLRSRLCATFGISPEYLLNEYGMTELSSQFYASSLPGLPKRNERRAPSAMPSALRPQHYMPPWVRVAAVDPETLAILPEGEIGVLRILDLANVDSVMAVQTEDLGRAWLDRIELLGRASGAELRGCSLLTEAIVRSA